MKDSYGRDINYLRISLTENCNLKCIYCMPENNISFEKKEILSLEQIINIARAAKDIGIKKIRLTGGEPLLRKDIVSIISEIKKSGIEEVYITTNGIYLFDMVEKLKNAGLSGVNISLDTLDSDEFKKITRGGNILDVLKGIEKAYNLNLKIKINSVVIKGINEDAIKNLSEITLNKNIDVRFIELMPVGEGKKFTGIKNEDIYTRLKKLFQFDEKYFETKGVTNYFKIKNAKGRIGFISPINNCFCNTCNKIRITSDGNIKRCLNIMAHTNIKDCNNIEKIKEILKNEILKKPEKHLFGKENKEEETKNMNQIGG